MNTTPTLCIVGLALLSSNALAQHDDDFVIGVTGSGMLAVEGHFDEAHLLPEFSDNGIFGWFGSQPGFASLDHDEPDEDFFMLAAGVDVHFELIATDPAFKVYTHNFDLLTPGDTFSLGGPDIHRHAFWHIDSNDPAFDPNQTIWNVSWRMIDLGTTGYADSVVYTSQFTNVPAPGVLSLAAAGLLGMASRRRR